LQGNPAEEQLNVRMAAIVAACRSAYGWRREFVLAAR
jgi:hypothetical protein